MMAAILLFWKRNWGEGTTGRENRNVREEKAFKTGGTLKKKEKLRTAVASLYRNRGIYYL